MQHEPYDNASSPHVAPNSRPNYRIIDISLDLRTAGLVYPADSETSIDGPFSFVPGSHREYCYHVSLSTQAGTHIQGSHYFRREGCKIDEYPLSRFEGSALIVDCPLRRIPSGLLAAALASTKKRVSVLLLRTGFTERLLTRWRESGRIPQNALMNKPGLTLGAARLLVRHNISLLGIDAPGIEPYPTPSHIVNRFLGLHDVLLLENLVNLGTVSGHHAWLECFPLPISGVEGTPCRAILKIPAHSPL